MLRFINAYPTHEGLPLLISPAHIVAVSPIAARESEVEILTVTGISYHVQEKLEEVERKLAAWHNPFG